MKRGIMVILLVTACLVGTVSGCQLISVTGSGTLETIEMDLSGFTSVTISHAFRVSISKSDSHFVSITTDDNLFDYIDVKKSGSTLYIEMKTGSYVRTTQEAIVRMPELGNISMSGATNADISGFQSSDSTKFSLSGASKLNLVGVKTGNTRFNISGASQVSGEIDTGDIRLDLSGASTVELLGSADNSVVRASGASHVKLADYKVNDVDIQLDGASTGDITMEGKLDVSLSGASKLTYEGTPTLGKMSTSGGSTVSKK